ncbi:g10980 [Coccomyxa elongata]
MYTNEPASKRTNTVRMGSSLKAGVNFANPVVLDVQVPADREWCREVFHEVDVEALSVYGEKASNAQTVHEDQDFLQTKTLASLTSTISADPELSANPLACRQRQIVAASRLYTVLLDTQSIKHDFLLQEPFLSGLVLMVDEGSPAMQLAAARLHAQLASDTAACKAICQVQGGLVIAMMLKTSKSAEGRAAAADCLIKLLPQLTPLERQIVWSAYPKPLHPLATN